MISEELSVHSEGMSRHFKSRRIHFNYCDNIEEARVKIRNLVSEFYKKDGFKKLGFGDIDTLHKLDIVDLLNQIPDLNIVKPPNQEETYKIENQDSSFLKENYDKFIDKMRESIMVDVYLTSVKAITLTGEIFSSDDIGNLIRGIIFGPRRVIMVVGKNNIFEDLKTAMDGNLGMSSVIVYGAMEGYKERVHLVVVNEDLKSLETGNLDKL